MRRGGDTARSAAGILSRNASHSSGIGHPARDAEGGMGQHIVMTANAAWNILNFRRPLVEAMLSDGHRVTGLAPADASVAALRAIGSQVVPLVMDVKGLLPWRDVLLIRAFRRHLKALRPDLVFGFTIENNIFGLWRLRRGCCRGPGLIWCGSRHSR